MGIMTLIRFDELVAMVRVKAQFASAKFKVPEGQADLKFCYDILKDVSRSFAAVIIQLNDELRDAVCIFYLVLRGLDTVEDDMAVPLALKKTLLPTFHEKLLLDDWHVDGIGKGQERVLLEEFWRVAKEFQKLKPAYQTVISDICHGMAVGMCHFLENEVVTKHDYNMYCHYVAGLVGHGLTRLWAASGLEDPSIARDLTISNSMGLFLQKANIIRDYYEDIREEPLPRMFWPREIWGTFGKELGDFQYQENNGRAVECLNALVADALQHVPDCVTYLSGIKEPSIFLFCAIPQVMAIATLEQLYGRGRTFFEKIKIRKGVACKIILGATGMPQVLAQFSSFLTSLERKLNEEDPSYDVTKAAMAKAWDAVNEARYGGGPQKEKVSVARRFLTDYPALGGRLVYDIVDSITGSLRQSA